LKALQATLVDSVFACSRFRAERLSDVLGGSIADVGLLPQCQSPAGTVRENGKMFDKQNLQRRAVLVTVLVALEEHASIVRVISL